MVVAVLLSGVAASKASAEWKEIYKGMPGGPHYGWYDEGVFSGRTVSGEGWKEVVRANAAAQARVGATGQPASMFGSKAATNSTTVIDKVTDAGKAAKGALLSQATKAKFLPALSVLGTVTNAGSAALLGWTVGSTLRDLFIEPKGEEPPPTFVTMVQQKFVAEGDKIATTCPAGGVPTCVSAYAPAHGSIAILGVTTPLSSTLLQVDECEGAWETQNHPWELGSGETPIAPSGGALVESDVSFNGEKGCKYKAGAYFLPLTAANLGLGDGFPGNVNKTTTAPGPVSPEDAESASEAALQDPIYDPANGAWAQEHSIGGVGTVGPGEALEVEVPAIKPGIKIKDYEKEAVEAGVNPVGKVLPSEATDTTKGPEEVTDTNPKPGTTVPAGSTVTVRYNPADAPEPSGTGWSPPEIASIDAPGALVGACDVFPFGVLCWAATSIQQVNVTPECPEWEIPYSPSGEDKMTITPCWDQIEGGLEYLRPAILFVWTLGLGFLFARATRAIGGGGGGD